MNADTVVAGTMGSFAPPPDLTVSEWAEENRRLPRSSASQGARWSNQTAPYLTEIMDACHDPGVSRLVIMGGSQTGKSESVHNAVGYWAEHDPSTVLWVMPSFDDAKRRSRGALADMIRSTPKLRAIVRGRRAPRGAHENESTLLEKVYPGGALILAGSGTPNTFAGITARRAVADEFERFAVLEEGAPAELMANRVSSFYDGLLVFISSPLLVDGPIDQQFKTTDQRRFHLACGCGYETWVAWQDENHFHVVYRDKDPSTARLACPGCGAEHDEAQRRRMVAVGRWLPTAVPVDPTARGYHLPSTISTIGDVSLSRVVQKWLSARANGPAALMTFVTTVLAEPWEDKGGKVDPHALALKLEDFGPDVDAPAGVVCLTAGVDVQIDRFELQVIGWGIGGESWVVDVRTIPGDPSHPEVKTALLTAIDERYRHASGQTLPILLTCVDSGYLPEKVAYDLAAKRPRRVFAIKGVGGRFGEPSILKYDPRKPPVILNVDGLKLEVALGLELPAPKPGMPAGPGYMHLNRKCCDEEYLAQLCAEHRERKRLKGVSTLIWVQDRERNEAQDTASYARGGLKLLRALGGSRTEDGMLQRMAAMIAAAAGTAAPASRPQGGGTPSGGSTPPARGGRRVARSGYLGR